MPFTEFLWWVLFYDLFLKVIIIFNVIHVTLMPHALLSFPDRLMMNRRRQSQDTQKQTFYLDKKFKVVGSFVNSLNSFCFFFFFFGV